MEIVQARKDDKVFGIINNVLERVFGEEATRLIYSHLERRCSLRQCEISSNIDVFTKGLEDFLKEAAYPIENKMNDILSVCGLENGVSLQIAMPEECDSDSQIRITTPNT
jgi:hypothetical protein